MWQEMKTTGHYTTSFFLSAFRPDVTFTKQGQCFTLAEFPYVEKLKVPGDERKYPSFQPHAAKSLALCSKERLKPSAMKHA